MERLRKVRKWGNTHVIIITKIDLKDLKLKEDDEVDISKLKKVKKEDWKEVKTKWEELL